MKPVADITGGNVLRIPAIQSPNYVANVSGWTINQDGSAQFNNATFIGSITITNGNDLLIYSTATPQLGSIVMALSPAAGSDTAGNTWGPGFTLFDGSTGATMVNFGANTGFEFANPTNIIGTVLRLSNVPMFIQSSQSADPSTIKGVHGAVYATTETLELMADTATLATDNHQSVIIQKMTESNGLDAADARFDYQSTAGTTTLLKLTNGQVAVPVAFVVNGKSTLDEQATISTSDANGALFIFQSVATTGNPGTISQSEAAAGNGAYAVFVNGDTHSRFVWDSNGKLRWGPGNAGLDSTLQRTSAGLLEILNALTVDGQLSVSATNAGVIVVTGQSAGQQLIRVIGTDATSIILEGEVSADTVRRFVARADGTHEWGSGAAGRDVILARTAAGILGLSTGSFAVTTAGQGLQVKEGSNAKMGTATLAGGTVVVSTTAVTATSRIFLTAQTSGAAPGALRVSARTAGTSFTITSTSATDTSTVAWLIMDPA